MLSNREKLYREILHHRIEEWWNDYTEMSENDYNNLCENADNEALSLIEDMKGD